MRATTGDHHRLGGSAVIGGTLALLIVGLWLSIHVWAMFVFQIGWTSWPLVPVIFALQCWLSVGMFIVAHDAMHGSLAPGRPRFNGAVGAFVLFLYAGFGWKTLRDAHFDHHRYVGTARDPDFHAPAPDRFWAWYGAFLRRYFGWRSMAYVWAVVLTYFFILGVPAANILFLFGLPAIASSLQLFYFGTFRPHRVDEAAFADRHRSRSEGWGYLPSLFSCFHFGYHHAHHLSPDVPWWRLPARNRSVVS